MCPAVWRLCVTYITPSAYNILHLVTSASSDSMFSHFPVSFSDFIKGFSVSSVSFYSLIYYFSHIRWRTAILLPFGCLAETADLARRLQCWPLTWIFKCKFTYICLCVYAGPPQRYLSLTVHATMSVQIWVYFFKLPACSLCTGACSHWP